jgi:hypothetical protein
MDKVDIMQSHTSLFPEALALFIYYFGSNGF